MFFFFISTLIITNIKPKDNEQSISVLDNKPVNILDDITHQSLTQFETIQNKISEISVMINDNQVPSLVGKNRQQVLTQLKQINSAIQQLVQVKYFSVAPSLNGTLFLIHQSRAFMLYILELLNKNFNGISNFNPQNYPFLIETIKRSNNQTASLSELIQEEKRNEKLLKKFAQKTEQIGLTWYNIGYRTIDSYVIDPCKRHNVLLHTNFLLSSLFMYTYLAWHFDNELPFISLPQTIKDTNWFRKNFGDKPFQAQLGISIGDEEKIEGRVNRADSFGARWQKGLLPFGAVMGAHWYTTAKKEWKILKPWINEKISILVNRLKGGSYLKKANKLQGIITSVYFEDMVGLKHVIKNFQVIVDYLENPELFDRLGIAPPKGFLLIGDTRTGKSYSVKALFNEIDRMLEQNNRKNEFKFLELNSSIIISEGIEKILSIVQEEAPCVVFIDEIDLLNLQRHGQNTMLMEFLTAMSGMNSHSDSKKQVIIIAATNQPETLDVALRTPGRFGKELRFEYPSLEERKEFITRELSKLALGLELFDIDKLSKETEGQPYEGLKLIINQSLLKARLRNEMFSQQHLDETLNEIIHNIIEEKFRDIPLHEQELLSIHFAGHALALMLLDTTTKLSSVTTKAVMSAIQEEFSGFHLWKNGNDDENKQKRIEYGEVFIHHDHDTINVMSKTEKLSLAQYYLAGIAAEKILNGSCGYSCHTQDKEKALTLVKSLVFQGIDVKKLPKEIQNQFHKEALTTLEQCEQEIINLLTENKEKLLAIKQALQQQSTLNKSDIQFIIEQIDSDAQQNLAEKKEK